MAFSSQFALSLELTRLLPLRTVANKTAEAFLSLARQLRNSGSDIVVEEDMAEIFGRCRIARRTESSFRTVVSQKGFVHELCEGLVVDSSAGPTVSRCLLEGNGPYFATVIQLSLLTAIHERESLANAIVDALHQRLIDAPLEAHLRAVPSQVGVEGVLRACHDETARFNWNHLLFAVASKLGMNLDEATATIRPVMIRSLTLLFPYVQSLPEDREIVIHADRGVCFLVVWAHHVLGFTVIVKERLASPGGFPETVFKGEFASTLIIDPNALTLFDSSVTLLERPTNESLIAIVPQADGDEEIGSAVRQPVTGYGMRLLISCWNKLFSGHDEKANDACLAEMIFISVALALRLSEYFYKVNSVDYQSAGNRFQPNVSLDLRFSRSPHMADMPGKGHYIVDIPKHKILESAQLVFDRKLSYTDITPYVQDQIQVTSSAIEIGHRVAEVFDKYDSDRYDWHDYFLTTIADLAFITLALSHVTNLENVGELLLREDWDRNGIPDQIRRWNGREIIPIVEDAWFSIAKHLLVGRSVEEMPHSEKNLALVSEGGWTLYLPTFGNPDPASIVSGGFVVKQGIPNRDGVRKHLVIDAPVTGVEEATAASYFYEGSEISFLEGIKTRFGRSLYAERGDSFIISLRIEQDHKGILTTRRTGYVELSRSVWAMMRTEPCQHHPDRELGEKHELYEQEVAIALQTDRRIQCSHRGSGVRQVDISLNQQPRS